MRDEPDDDTSDMSDDSRSRSQSLERGLIVLEEVAGSSEGVTASELARRLEVSRTIVVRLLKALEERRYVVRVDGLYRVGGAVAGLMDHYHSRILDAARPMLRDFTTRHGVTSHFCLLEGDETVAAVVVHPFGNRMFVSESTGARRPAGTGASGIACLVSAGRTWPGAERRISGAVAKGFATSESEVQTGTCGVAAPVFGLDGRGASVGSIMLAGSHDLDQMGRELRSMADALREG